MKFHIFNNGLVREFGMSGSDRRALEWTKIFLENNIQITLYTSSFGKKRYKIFKKNFELIVISDMVFLKNTFIVYLFRAFKSIFKVKSVCEGDIFYSTSDLLPDSIPALVSKICYRKTKWVTGLHLLAPNPISKIREKSFDIFIKEIYYYFSQNIVLFLAKYLADLILVSNNLDKETMIKRNFPKNRIMVTYGAVDWPEIKKAKKSKILYTASFIGRFHPQKGLDDLLTIWKKIVEKQKKAKLAMIGELEPLLPKIKQMHLKNNIDFLGVIDGVKKFSILKSSKLFLFPSTYESFGIVAAEAMACGIPVVAYNLPVYYDIYPKGMIKVPLGDCDSFASEVLKLLEDNHYRKKISRESVEMAKRFSWKKTAENIVKYLEEK